MSAVNPGPYQITVTQAAEVAVDAPLLCRAVEAALRRHGAPGAQVDVAVVADDTIAELNEKHLGHSGSTDVLTFDLRDSCNSPRVEGQIVLSLDTARREAAGRGHSLQAELSLYAIHGTLHLLGHDDQTAEAAAAMHGLEDELLTALGFGGTYARPRQCEG